MTGRPTSITEFITDGSLSALCDTAGRILGARVALRDEHGRLVSASGGLAGGDGPVRIETLEDPSPPAFSAPILLADAPIGSLSLLDRGAAEPESAHRFLMMVATIVGELCSLAVALSRRVEELDVMHKLTRLLVGGRDLDTMLGEGLRAGVALLGADAGTLRVLDERGQDLELRASIGVSDAYLAAAATLPAQEALARAALEGEAVAIEDLLSDDRVMRRAAIRQEGLASMLSAGLVFHDETMGILRIYSRAPRRFTRAEQALLASIGRQIASAVATVRLLDAETRARGVRRQLELAAEVQRRMMPRAAPETDAFDIAAEHESSLDLSGDFYDVFRLGGRIGVVVGDVAGKGVPAALLMASVRASLRAYARAERLTGDVAEIVARANRALCRDSLPQEFVTIFLGLLDPETRTLTYTSAGHEPTLLVRAAPPGQARRIETLDTGGLVAGVDPKSKYETARVQLDPGDTLVISTDGLPEAMDFQQRTFGRQRVRGAALDLLLAEPDATAARLASHLLWEMRRFTGLSAKSDDATIVAVRVRPPGAEPRAQARDHT